MALTPQQLPALKAACFAVDATEINFQAQTPVVRA